jgi:hypothetical protein
VFTDSIFISEFIHIFSICQKLMCPIQFKSHAVFLKFLDGIF